MSNLLKMSKQKLINISALAKEIHLIEKRKSFNSRYPFLGKQVYPP